MRRFGLICSFASLLGGCTVLAAADTVGTIAVKTVGVAADATIGTVRVAGKVVGKATDTVLGDGTKAPQ